MESDHGPAAEASGKSAAPRVETAVKLHHRPAVAGTEKGVFFFAKDAWGRVHFNRAALGQSFEGWHDVADNALAVFPPAAATVGAYVYTVMAGTGGEVYLAQGGGNAFTPWSPMGFQTDDAPAVAGTTRHVYFFATHGDDVFYNWSVTNEGGKGWKRVDGDAHADSGPSAGAVRNHIFVAVRTGEGKIAYNQADAEQAFNPTWASMDFKTDTAPAVAGAEDTIYFFARAPDGRVFYTSALLGQSFSDWRAMDDSIRAASAPAAGAVGGHLFIAVIGEDRKLHYNQGGVGSNFGRWDVMDLP